MESTSGQNKVKLFRFLEQVFVVLGAVISLAVVSLFAVQQANDLWPFPGIYFIEISVLAILSAASRLVSSMASSDKWRSMPWIAGGVLLPFVILGGFSIGPFLLPAMLAFLLAGIIADLRVGRGLGAHVGLAILAALIQLAVVIVVNMLFLAPR